MVFVLLLKTVFERKETTFFENIYKLNKVNKEYKVKKITFTQHFLEQKSKIINYALNWALF